VAVDLEENGDLSVQGARVHRERLGITKKNGAKCPLSM